MTMGAHIVGQKCGTSVPMAELRGFVDRLRDHYGVPYPLAHHQPFVSGRQLVYEAQEGSGLAPEFCLVAAVSGQYVLTPASESYLTRVTWDGDIQQHGARTTTLVHRCASIPT